jgi:hypothetical protein
MGMKVSRELEAKCLELAAKAATVPHTLGIGPARHVLTIAGWTPTPLNRLLTTHHMKAHRLKMADLELVSAEATRQFIPWAGGRRRVSVRVQVPNTSRAADPDGYLKVLLDALVGCGRLKDDSSAWMELGPVTVEKGKKATVVTLEDLT